MLKKLFALGIFVAIASCAWHKTRVIAMTEQVRVAWQTSQDQQALEHWDVHVSRELRGLRAQADALERRAKSEALAAEIALVRRDRITRDVERATQLVSEFRARLADGNAFSYAGQEYGGTLAEAQLSRYAAELAALEQQAKAATAQHEARSRCAEQCQTQAAALTAKIAEVEEKSRQIALRRQVLSAQAELRRIEQRHEQRCRLDARPLASVSELFKLAEAELDRLEAEQRIEERAQPPRTLSLDETLERQPRY